MNPAELVKGKKYNYFNSVINKNVTVYYVYEQVNYYVFRADGENYFLPHGRVQSNITEIV